MDCKETRDDVQAGTSQPEFTPEQLERGRRWVEALRSGEFAQCDSQLKRFDAESDSFSYCCLGVASELFIKECGGEWETEDAVFIEGTVAESFLHPSIARWLGVDALPKDGTVTGNEVSPLTTVPRTYSIGFQSLADLNDHGKCFSEIADIIERDIYKGQLYPERRQEAQPSTPCTNSLTQEEEGLSE